MAQPILLIPPQAFGEAMADLPVAANCADGKVVTVQIDWARYGASTLQPDTAVQINLVGRASAGPLLDKVRSVYIDNTYSDVPVYVQFRDTNYVIVCPPGAVTNQPVFTNAQDCIVYVEGVFSGRVPYTRIAFGNYSVAGYTMQTDFLTPFQLSMEITAMRSLGASGVYPNVYLGPEFPDRLIAVIAIAARHDGTAVPITDVLINGAPMAIALTDFATGITESAVLERITMAVAYRRVPLGLAATIQVVAPALQGTAIGVYAIRGQSQDAPYDVRFGSTGSAGVGLGAEQLVLPLNTLNGGASILGSVIGTDNPGDYENKWLNADNDGFWRLNPPTAPQFYGVGSFAHIFSELSGVQSGTTQAVCMIGASWI